MEFTLVKKGDLMEQITQGSTIHMHSGYVVVDRINARSITVSPIGDRRIPDSRCAAPFNLRFNLKTMMYEYSEGAQKICNWKKYYDLD